MTGEHLKPEFLAKNPFHQLPTYEGADGTDSLRGTRCCDTSLRTITKLSIQRAMKIAV